jgi:hypothetical protein
MQGLCCKGSRAGYKEQVVLKQQAARLPLQLYFSQTH